MLIFFPTSVTCAKHSGFGNACTCNSDAAPPVPFVNGGTRPPGPPAMPTFSGIVCGAKTGKTCNSYDLSFDRSLSASIQLYQQTFHATVPVLHGYFQSYRPNATNTHGTVHADVFCCDALYPNPHPIVSSDGCSTPRCTTGCDSRPPDNVSTTGQTRSPCCSVRHGCTGTAPKRYVWPDLHVFCILTVI